MRGMSEEQPLFSDDPEAMPNMQQVARPDKSKTVSLSAKISFWFGLGVGSWCILCGILYLFILSPRTHSVALEEIFGRIFCYGLLPSAGASLAAIITGFVALYNIFLHRVGGEKRAFAGIFFGFLYPLMWMIILCRR